MRKSNKLYSKTGLFLLLTLIPFSNSSAIIMRHDVPDSAYIEKGKNYPQVCTIGRMGSGTLVAPNWIITAAHVAQGAEKMNPKIKFGEQEFEIDKIVKNPDWEEMQPGDIALIRLNDTVHGIEPVLISTDKKEKGQEIVFVGCGGNGTGLTGPMTEDGQWRAATNKIDRADDHWLFFNFDDPTEKESDGTPLEGISGPGDSGGPALIEKDGKLYIAGVSVFGNPGKNGRGTYGSDEGYTRVSHYADWINKVLKGKE